MPSPWTWAACHYLLALATMVALRIRGDSPPTHLRDVGWTAVSAAVLWGMTGGGGLATAMVFRRHPKIALICSAVSTGSLLLLSYLLLAQA